VRISLGFSRRVARIATCASRLGVDQAAERSWRSTEPTVDGTSSAHGRR